MPFSFFNYIMITLMVLPNFKGSLGDWIKATITCLALDAMYIVPLCL